MNTPTKPSMNGKSSSISAASFRKWRTDSNLKILLISREYPPQTRGGGGGIGSYAACIAPTLAGLGHEVHVLSCMAGQDHRDELQDGVHIHRRGLLQRGFGQAFRFLPGHYTLERFRQGLTAFVEYRRLGINFDVIEYPDWFAEGWVFALLRPRPLVAHVHAPLPVLPRFAGLRMDRDVGWACWLERFGAHRGDIITTASSRTVKTLRELGWLQKQHVEIIPYPIDWQRWQNTQPAGDTPPVVLFLGRVERIKAPEVLVEAISIVRQELPEARALFVGQSNGQWDGLPYMEWIKKSSTDVSGCEFVGRVPREEVPQIFSKCRVLAMTSRFEGFANAALEAMAAGRPVVVASTQGQAEVVERGGGRIIPAEDPKALAHALLPFLKDAAYAAREGEKAKRVVQEYLDPHKIAGRRERIFREAINRFHQSSRLAFFRREKELSS